MRSKPAACQRRNTCSATISSTQPPMTRRAVISEIPPSTHHPAAIPSKAGPSNFHTGRHEPCFKNAG